MAPALMRYQQNSEPLQTMNRYFTLLLLLSVTLCATAETPSNAQTQVFELRTYTAAPGKLAELNARFRNHTLALFERHGMKNVAYWIPQDAPRASDTIIYVLAHESREAAAKSWQAFSADPGWQKVKAASEANGPIVTKVESVFMVPIDYSPMK